MVNKKNIKCISCKNEIPIGKYYRLFKGKPGYIIGYEGDCCSSCWIKEQVKYETLIKEGLLKVEEVERKREKEREREQNHRCL